MPTRNLWLLNTALPLALIAGLALAGRDRIHVADPAPIPAGLTLLSSSEIAQASATIDALVEANHAKHAIQAMPVATDGQFVRRAYLSIVGRIPTAEEALSFLASTASTKRAVLVDRLIASEGRVHHEFTWWADLLRVQTRPNNNGQGQPFIDWIKSALKTNMPYDRMVREMVTAEGPVTERGNGATGFYVRDQGMPLDRVANLSQTFLGTQIGCAQCHDHPFDQWKRREFFEFAAYLHGSDSRRDGLGTKADRQKLKQAADNATPQERNLLRRVTESLSTRVNSSTKTTVPLPEDYQYDDAKPKENVQAKVLFGADAPIAKGTDPRAAFATWLTAPENPRFATVIANRLWKKAFGIGLIEPVDDIRDDTVASNPELMDFLTRLMVSVKYDIAAFQAILYKTRTWQRQAVRVDLQPGEIFHIPGPVVRRLTAEQIWDSLLTLAVKDLDHQYGENAEHLYTFYDDHKDMPVDQILAQVKQVSQARTLNEEIRKQGEMLRSQLTKAQGKESENLRAQLKALNGKRDQLRKTLDTLEYRPKAKAGGLKRAAELSQPAPPGHFLRVFGQSDRETIDNATPSPAVTQALHLLNGPLGEAIAQPGSPLRESLAKATDDASRTRALYLALLGRQPDADELAVGAGYLQRYGDQGLEDLAWALMNANEFLFLQ